jgi:tetratricopeptide (TPR) repeat protein
VARARVNAQHSGASLPTPEKVQADAQYQAAIKNFEVGVRAFHKQNYDKAAEIFEKLAAGNVRDVADRAQMHLQLCKQRTGRPAPLPKSADNYYALGVACLNARQFEAAIGHLNKADKLKPRQDHIHYALAVAHSVTGDADAALVHLEMAFSLRPENRIHARRDEDLRSLVADPRFHRLVHLAES